LLRKPVTYALTHTHRAGLAYCNTHTHTHTHTHWAGLVYCNTLMEPDFMPLAEGE